MTTDPAPDREPLTSIDDLAEHLGYGELPLPDPTPAPASPAAGLRFGDPVRLRCGATGRYLGRGTKIGLFVSAMDNDLSIDEIDLSPGAEPWAGSPLPSLEACSAANVGICYGRTL